MALDDDEWRSCLQCKARDHPSPPPWSIALRRPSCLGAGIVSGTPTIADEGVVDVAVVGSGPAPRARVGLQQRGMSVAVYERDAHFRAAARLRADDPAGGTALKALGIADAVTAVGSKAPAPEL